MNLCGVCVLCDGVVCVLCVVCGIHGICVYGMYVVASSMVYIGVRGGNRCSYSHVQMVVVLTLLSSTSIHAGHEEVAYTVSKIHNSRFPSSTHWPGIWIFFFLFFLLGMGRGEQCLPHTVLISECSFNGMFGSHWSPGLSHCTVS